MKRMKLPTFLFIGSAKTGSTWMSKALQAHPEVYVPPAKELHFFDDYYHKGLSWYAAFFSKASDDNTKALGELSPRYIYVREAAERIAKDLPNVKLFACLRNPIDRAVSAYHFKKRNGIAGPDFFSTIEESPQILERGKYSSYVKMYLDIFGSENFKVFFYDDLKQDPALFAKQMYQFIGVNAEYEYIEAKKKVLAASEPRSVWLAAFTKKMARHARKKGLIRLMGWVKNSFFVRMLYKPIDKKKPEALTDAEKAWLKDYYADDVTKLEKLLNCNLQHWLL